LCFGRDDRTKPLESKTLWKHTQNFLRIVLDIVNTRGTYREVFIRNGTRESSSDAARIGKRGMCRLLTSERCTQLAD
jgi:hypothetical protein